jgi:hypothetical protein
MTTETNNEDDEQADFFYWFDGETLKPVTEEQFQKELNDFAERQRAWREVEVDSLSGGRPVGVQLELPFEGHEPISFTIEDRGSRRSSREYKG